MHYMAAFETFREELDLLMKPKTELRASKETRALSTSGNLCGETRESQSRYSICMCWESWERI